MDEFTKRIEALSTDKRELLEIFLKEKRLQTPWLQHSYVAPRDEVETALAKLWSQVLGVERVGVDDNFFELGGDSILSIQIIAKAAEMGLGLNRNQLFEHPTIAELAPLAAAARRREEAEDETGPFPLAPAQLAQLAAGQERACRAVLLQLAEPDAERLARSARLLVEHHAALRVACEHVGGGWQQRVAAAAEPSLDQQDLSHLEATAQAAVATRALSELQASCEPDRGTPLRLRLLSCGRGRPAFVALAVPALVCDEESLRILIDDLRSAYAQLGPGQPPEQRAALPPRTTSFPHWCRELSRHAASPELAKELEWWDGQAAALPLPFDRPTTVVSPAAVQAVAVALDADTSRMLLQEMPARHRTQVTELVLAALARTVAAWAGTTSVCFDVDGSVRGESVLGMDLSRTAGACDFVYPIQLSLAGAASPMAALKAVKEQLRAIPCRGLGYALLAGGAGAGDAASAAGSERLRSRPRAELRVSYRSSFAAGEGLDSPILRLAAEPLGPPPQAAGSYPLRLVAGAAGGMVRLELEFDGGRYDRSTVERLARRLEEELLRTVAEAREGSALTPADFPDAELGAADLDLLFARP